MPRPSAGVSGLAVGVAAAGGLLLYSGIRGLSPIDVLRGIVRGQLPEASAGKSFGEIAGEVAGQLAQAQAQQGIGEAGDGTPGTVRPVSSSSSTSMGEQAAAAAAKYLGIPYRFGGATPAGGFDCSGLVTYVLHHDLGLSLPSNSHTLSGQFYTWSGARTIARSQCAAGDLVCWPGHVAIATDNANMIAAPHVGTVVQRQKIYSVPPPLIRRPLAYGATVVI
jgi:cell wall-associated NlpC family hydrolase